MTPKAQSIEGKSDKLSCDKFKSFCLCVSEPVLYSTRSHRTEKPVHHERKATHSSRDPARPKINKLKNFLIKSFCALKDTPKKMKREDTSQKKIFTNHIFDKRFVSRGHKELLQLDN